MKNRSGADVSHAIHVVIALALLATPRAARADWPVSGRDITATAGAQQHSAIATDGAAGAIVAWGDCRVVGTGHIFAQHALGTGGVDLAWPVDGRGLSNAGALESRALAVADGAGGAIVNWQALNVHLNMFAQHVLSNGVVDSKWPSQGRALSAVDRDQVFAEIVPDGSGGALVAWQDSDAIVAQHVLGTGAADRAYPASGLVLADLPSQRGDIAVVATGLDGAIASWTDTRTGSAGPDIFALQVTAVATLGVPGGPGGTTSGLGFASSGPNPALHAARVTERGHEM